jgi:hypothetical protein
MTNALGLDSAPLLLPEDDETAKIVMRIAHLRTQPEGPMAWKDVEYEVALGPKVIKRYVWVLAALLRARDLTWEAISKHPWVEGKLTEAYLRNKHANTKLPTGQKFSEFVDWYVDELRARFQELMAEQARHDSVNIRQLCLDVLLDCKRTQRKLSAGQQSLDFNDEVPLSEDELEIEDLRTKIRDRNTAAIGNVFKLLRLTTASPTEITATPEEAAEAAAPLTEAELLAEIKLRRKNLKSMEVA